MTESKGREGKERREKWVFLNPKYQNEGHRRAKTKVGIYIQRMEDGSTELRRNGTFLNVLFKWRKERRYTGKGVEKYIRWRMF